MNIFPNKTIMNIFGLPLQIVTYLRSTGQHRSLNYILQRFNQTQLIMLMVLYYTFDYM